MCFHNTVPPIWWDRARRVHLNQEQHIYTLDGDEIQGSVTSFLGVFWPVFDAVAVIERCYDAWVARNHPVYANKTKEEIRALWASNTAAAEGTEMHARIERWIIRASARPVHPQPAPASPPPPMGAVRFLQAFLRDHVALATEMTVFDEELQIAGQIDFLARRRADDTIVIVDWKRSKHSIRPDARAFGRGLHVFDESNNRLPANSYHKYALQLNLYRYILHRRYGVTSSDMLLVRIHPDMGEGKFECQRVEAMDGVMSQCIRHGLEHGLLGRLSRKRKRD